MLAVRTQLGISPAYRIPRGASSTTTIQFRPSSTLDHVSAEKPRSFPTEGFPTIEPDQPLEEEQLFDYSPHRYYPAYIGEIFQGRYQVCAKLGWGSCSTTWLARDLRDKKYVALKVYIHNSVFHRELPFYKHIAPFMSSDHPGRECIRRFFDSFIVTGPDGKHIVLVQEPACISLFDFKQNIHENGFPEENVKSILEELLNALDFLHTECKAVHTDVHIGNLLACMDDSQNAKFKGIEETEINDPSARKQVSPDRTIYLSRAILPKEGPLKLSDFGEARIGPGPYDYPAMPMPYRAPEVTLEVPWSYPVDIWCVGLTACDLLGLDMLFRADHTAGNVYEAAHLAELIAVLGPPPTAFLELNPERAAQFWDEEGKWKDLVPIPEIGMLESLEGQLGLPLAFVKFMRRTLTWMPNERATAKELLEDPWLKG
ncbi:hypothetical protein N7491_010988 [Penicillium cf. griseofulvum]|uniref:non-specific serine/threonine protein kinase n=1 Tax=Penicillium cf. griseofulvum TaxID=2972120 RepID=A0A9W9N0U6_9EURO|nr:hypothetical protein N7472_001307 [Penicillium cf. griseofulvum]KAJ5422543.1 hypothetical protein N7491_010988 [Penicillium cf. griseofulvum]KAJ5428720.1 hypothetical protein N7445_010174 [Penicillium cf. griseofulvum]